MHLFTSNKKAFVAGICFCLIFFLSTGAKVYKQYITDHVDLDSIGTNTHAELDTHEALTTNAHGLTYTAEGDGGGLDADTVDGLEASDFAGSGDVGDHLADTENPHDVTKIQVGLSNVQNLKVKLDATTAPTVNNDTTEGYSPGSQWIDQTNDTEHICLDSTEGAAQWTETTGEGGGGTPGGSDTHVQYNDGDAFGGDADWTYNDTLNHMLLQNGLLAVEETLRIYRVGSLDYRWDIKAPSGLAANYTLTLPLDDGEDGEILKTDGNGVLAWAYVMDASTAIHDNMAGEIAAITEKGSPTAGDWLLIEDAADDDAKKRVNWSALPGASELSDLSDVGVTTPTDGNVMRADGDSWESVVLGHSDITPGDGSDHPNVATNTTHGTGDGSGHADVATNTTHGSSDGSSHANVTTNTTHGSSEGIDHSNVKKSKFNATTAPTTDNDTTEGYTVGSRWADVTNKKEYVCLDNAEGAAEWTETTAGAGGGATELSELSDVGVTTPTNKNALMADGGSWESRPIVEADISDLLHDAEKIDGIDIAIGSPANDDIIRYDSVSGDWVYEAAPGATGGEANTASNVGSEGVGVWRRKTDVDLEFRHIAPENAKITVALSGQNILIGLGAVALSDISIDQDLEMGSNKIAGRSSPSPYALLIDADNNGATDLFIGKSATYHSLLWDPNADPSNDNGRGFRWNPSTAKLDFNEDGSWVTLDNMINAREIKPVAVTIDPGAHYDLNTNFRLFTVGPEAPYGITIIKWTVDFGMNPDPEVIMNFCYADDWAGTNENVIDVLNTVNGTSSEDEPAFINGDIANGKVLYLSIEADPEGTGDQMTFEFWYVVEEG